MQVMFVGQTFTGQYDSNGNPIMTGSGPDYTTLAPLTLPGSVYQPYPSVIYPDGNSQLNNLTLIYDDSNEQTIITSITTITGVSYYSYPITVS
jgi:hypothetical protein